MSTPGVEGQRSFYISGGQKIDNKGDISEVKKQQNDSLIGKEVTKLGRKIRTADLTQQAKYRRHWFRADRVHINVEIVGKNATGKEEKTYKRISVKVRDLARHMGMGATPEEMREAKRRIKEWTEAGELESNYSSALEIPDDEELFPTKESIGNNYTSEALGKLNIAQVKVFYNAGVKVFVNEEVKTLDNKEVKCSFDPEECVLPKSTDSEIHWRIGFADNSNLSDRFTQKKGNRIAVKGFGGDSKKQKLYERNEIEELLVNAYFTFRKIAEHKKEKEAHIHIAEWGGNVELEMLVQLLAANAAGIDHVHFYSEENREAFTKAKTAFDNYKKNSNERTTISHLAIELSRERFLPSPNPKDQMVNKTSKSDDENYFF